MARYRLYGEPGAFVIHVQIGKPAQTAVVLSAESKQDVKDAIGIMARAFDERRGTQLSFETVQVKPTGSVQDGS